MKVSSTVVIVIITLLCIFPFVWFMLIGQKATLKSKKIIKGLIQKEDLTLNNEAFWNRSFIGIDPTKNILLYVKLTTETPEVLKLDLNDVKTCRINRVARDYKHENRTESELQSLFLEIGFASNKPDVALKFYDIEDKFSENLEMNRAETWQKAILEAISKNSSKNTAA